MQQINDIINSNGVITGYAIAQAGLTLIAIGAAIGTFTYLIIDGIKRIRKA